MPVPSQVHEILAEIYAGCDEGYCPCRLKFDPARGLVPRGVAGAEDGCEAVELVVVGINPGHPRAEEVSRYAEAWSNPPRKKTEKKIEDLIEETTDWADSPYVGGGFEGRSQYHSRLSKFLKRTFSTKENESLLRRVYFTELVKCSTENGAGVFSSPELREATRTCITGWLAREVRFFPNAKAILALGMDVYKALCLWDGDTKVVYLPHPSRPFRSPSNVRRAREELRQALGM